MVGTTALMSPVGFLKASNLWAKDRRMDAESFLTPGFYIREQIAQWPAGTKPLGDLASVVMPNRLGAVRVDRQHGVPFLAATQVFDIRPRPRKWLAPGRTPEFKDRLVASGVILVTRSGLVGDCIVSYSIHENAVISDDLLRVKATDDEMQGFLYAYLRSPYAKGMMRSTKYGNIIKHLEPEHLRQLPVPLVPEALRRSVSQMVWKAFDRRTQAASLTDQAEKAYVNGLGLKEPDLAPEYAYTVPASEMYAGSRRLDGFHYNPEAEAAYHALQASGRKTVELGSVVDEVFGVGRFKHIYQKAGIPYVDSEDLFKVNPTLEKFIPPAAKKNASAYYVKRNWLLMACSGQIYGLNGSVVLAGKWHEEKIISNHVLRIRPKPEGEGLRPGYLQVALSHAVFGRPLVVRYAFGTEVPEIAPDDVANIPIIAPSASLEEAVANLIDKAHTLREEADALEDAAVAELEAVLSEAIDPPAELSASHATPADEE